MIKSGYIDRGRVKGQSVTLEIYHSNFSFTVVTKVKLWEVTFHPFGEWITSKESLDKEGAIWIRKKHSG